MGFFTFIKSLTVIWPFIKEILLSNKTIQEKIRRNKVSTTYILANVFLFTLFVYAFSEARSKDSSIVELQTKLTHAQEALEAEKADHNSDMTGKDDFWSPQLEQLKRENGILTDRVELLKKRVADQDIIIADNRETIGLLRRQIELYQGKERSNTPQQRNNYSIELEKLRQQEQTLDRK